MDYVIKSHLTIEPRGEGEPVHIEGPNILAKNVKIPPSEIAKAIEATDTDHFLVDVLIDLGDTLAEDAPSKPALPIVESAPANDDGKSKAKDGALDPELQKFIDQMVASPTFKAINRRKWQVEQEDMKGDDLLRLFIWLCFNIDDERLTFAEPASKELLLDFMASAWNASKYLPAPSEPKDSVILQKMDAQEPRKEGGLTETDLRRAAALQMSPTLTKITQFAIGMPEDIKAAGGMKDAFVTALIDTVQARDAGEIALKTDEASAMFHGLLTLALIATEIKIGLEEAKMH